MELNPYIHYRVSQERSADAMRAAEHWRAVKSLEEQDGSSGWLRAVVLSLKQLVLTHTEDGAYGTSPRAREARPSPRRTVPSPRL